MTDEEKLEMIAEELKTLCEKYGASIHLDGYFHGYDASVTVWTKKWLPHEVGSSTDYTGEGSLHQALQGLCS